MILADFLSIPGEAVAQIPDGSLFRRVSRLSNFEFAIHNNGLLYGDHYGQWADTVGFSVITSYWPRGSYHMQGLYRNAGPVFLAKKAKRFLVSDPCFRELYPPMTWGPFIHTVPGRIGDPHADFDPDFQGNGWRYVNDPDYIVYSSLDYNEKGVDVSGSNYNDWPIRSVDGEAMFVADPLGRSQYPACYRSDEDLFCVFKDTDTRSDPLYKGPAGPSVPIGLEFQQTVFTWGTGPGKDIVLFQYDVWNKSGAELDSCYFIFAPQLLLRVLGNLAVEFSLGKFRQTRLHTAEPWRNLTYTQPLDLGNPAWARYWTATPRPPTVGFCYLETPIGYSGSQLGLTRVIMDSIDYYWDESGQIQSAQPNDSIFYRMLTGPRWLGPVPPSPTPMDGGAPMLQTGSFSVNPERKVRICTAFIFADDLTHLLLLHDFITRVYRSGFKRPSPPPVPRLAVQGLDRALKLSWDDNAESAVDEIIPDSLGAPFLGYRLLRAERKEGPYREIGRWVKDSALVHEYLDRGDQIGGLKNNRHYYYRLLSFDAGSIQLKLDPMECGVVDGVNAQEGIPGVEPVDVSATEGFGVPRTGTLGGVTGVRIVPRKPTNYNRLIVGKQLTVEIGAATDGVRYSLPVAVSDSVSGRAQNAVLDLGLYVHGNPSIAGVREGMGWVRDVFGLDGADIAVEYHFEQLSEPFHIEPTIQSGVGADVPVIAADSLGVTGVQLVTPYTTGDRELDVELQPGGEQTILGRGVFPYLIVQIRDLGTGNLLTWGTDWSMAVTVVADTGTVWFPLTQARYYFSGALSNGSRWEIGHLLKVNNSAIAFDAKDRGKGSGKKPPLFPWASTHHGATIEFKEGDRVRLHWKGGVSGTFPRGAVVELTAGTPQKQEVTAEMLEGIRIVPNPYMVRDGYQSGEKKLYFNYLPEECTIRIYTVSLDRVKVLEHRGGSSEEWDLKTEGGELVASQMLLAHIEASNGLTVVKKFAIVVGK